MRANSVAHRQRGYRLRKNSSEHTTTNPNPAKTSHISQGAPRRSGTGMSTQVAIKYRSISFRTHTGYKQSGVKAIWRVTVIGPFNPGRRARGYRFRTATTMYAMRNASPP